MDKAGEHARARSFDVDVLAQARLAPDQFAFAQQVQAACDQAKYAAAYLGGKPAPWHPDTEKTFAEFRERIRKCTSFLATVFFFHVTLAYATLRHNGVELGKMDYIGGLPTQEG